MPSLSLREERCQLGSSWQGASPVHGSWEVEKNSLPQDENNKTHLRREEGEGPGASWAPCHAWPSGPRTSTARLLCEVLQCPYKPFSVLLVWVQVGFYLQNLKRSQGTRSTIVRDQRSWVLHRGLDELSMCWQKQHIKKGIGNMADDFKRFPGSSEPANG